MQHHTGSAQGGFDVTEGKHPCSKEVRACDFQGGLKTKARGHKGLSAPPRGAQKGRGTLGKWVLEAAILKMYGFPQEIHRFSKNARALPGGVLGAFFA